jgi:hydroxymethylpyrimidine pyrophosphatase-like HAD family hydrolase
MADICGEERFYSRYDWCLNPILSIRQLLAHLNEELDGYRVSEGWQREECRINLYLFACAIVCTIDDYFNQRLLNLSLLRSRAARLDFLLAATEWVLNTPVWLLKIVANWRAWRWRKRLNSGLHEICDLLIAGGESRMTSSTFARVRLPERLLNHKMRLPEAFRAQDFTHQDVISLARRFCASSEPNGAPVTIVGLGAGGAYFAPLIAAYLKRSKWEQVSWFSIRPESGMSIWETWRLWKLRRRNTRVVLAEDYPGTGAALRLTVQILQQVRIRTEQISILAPTHAAQPDWIRLAGIPEKVRVFTIYPAELYKSALLQPESVESWYAEYFSTDSTASTRFRVIDDTSIEELNRKMAAHSEDGHHVREKRFFAVELGRSNGASLTRKIFVKSTGWGWLGYHAYIAGKRLDGFVPRIIGLRNGLLITEWIDDTGKKPNAVLHEHMVDVLASYVAARSRNLRLPGDCRLDSRAYRWTGLDEIVTILRHAYSPYIRQFKSPGLRKQLYKHVTSMPTLIDGRMRPEEWLQTSTAIYKADFEHHNFGCAELNVADPAYDLASAIFEFRLTKQCEEQLLRNYVRISGDCRLSERIIIYKILYASMAMRQAVTRILDGKEPQKNNGLYQYARDFLVYSMNEFCAGWTGQRKPPAWSDSLFFVDLDGVFDQELLGFPHATESGLQALMLLQSNGYSVVLNTGRSVQHIRQYCKAYGIPGGIAEFGSVFVDAVQKNEVPLIDEAAAARQLAKCREAIRTLPGVFVDPGYEHAIRAYRYKGQSTAGLSVDEIRALLETEQFGRLTYISREADSYIVQNGTGKGAGVTFVNRYLNNDAPTAAIGDSEQDIPMLEVSDYPYAPANCSLAVREFAKTARCHVLKEYYQAGFLAAVQHRLKNDGISEPLCKLDPMPDRLAGLMQTLLRVADRPRSLHRLADLIRGE